MLAKGYRPTKKPPTTAAGRALVESARQRSSLTWRDTPNHVALVAKTVEQTTTMVLAIEAEARASLDVVAAARALRERLTIDPGNVVSWAEWDTLDEALAKLGAKP